MIGWYTDNELSRLALSSIAGIDLKHIKNFSPTQDDHVFYGLHRGSSYAIHLLKYFGIDYYYIDNGYFDALYANTRGLKKMDGKFRVVRNDTIKKFTGSCGGAQNVTKALIIPPTEYTAMHHLTTPEDWCRSVGQPLLDANIQIHIRKKTTDVPLENDLAWCDAVIAFNSMVIVRAIEAGKAVSDTHGILRHGLFARYDLQEIKDFYDKAQFTLKELEAGAWV